MSDMKKWNRAGWILIPVVMCAVALFTTACEDSVGNDDNQNNGNNTNSTNTVVSPLVGAWNMTQLTAEGQTWTPTQLGWTWQITFFNNNTYTAIQTWQGAGDEYSGTWAVSGDQLTLEDSISGQYAVSGSQLTIISADYDGRGTSGTVLFQKM